MFCRHCGTENEKSARFCQRCGAALAGSARVWKRTPWLWIAAVGGTLIVLAAALVVLVRLLQGTESVILAPTTTVAPATVPASDSSPTEELGLASLSTPSPNSTSELGTSNLYIEYILDASNSMNDALPDGTVKRTVAEKLLAEHLRAFRPETNIGLRAFGHRVGSAKEESCQDIEQVAPVEKGQVERIVSWLRDVQPRGWTPLAEAIRQATGDFVFDPARINAVVLLSDGQETCGGDPCRLVEELKAQGINFTIHVIGLNVDEPTRQQLTCIAQEAGGTYHDASSEQDLGQALGDVRGDVSVGEIVIPPGTHTPTPVPLTSTPMASPPSPGRIAFFRWGTDAIYVMNSDGTGVTQVTSPGPGVASRKLQWSPDGTQLAFVRGYPDQEVHIVSASGTGLARLAPGISLNPSWSPDGSRIAFEGWDPDGTGIGIYVVHPDGSGLSLLPGTSRDDWYPMWAPDGSRIAFSRWDDHDLNVYVMKADGSGQSRVTSEPGNDGWPCWLSGSTRIAFESYTTPGHREIYTIDVDGTHLINVSSDPGDDSNPVCSPDGKHVAFVAMRDGNAEIYLADAFGRGLTNLTRHAASDFDPAWSPTGRHIAFASDRDGNREIYVMNLDGSEVTRLTYDPAGDTAPAWAP